MDTTLKLTRPIKVHDEEVYELTLREPCGKDSEDLGSPYELIPRSGTDESALRFRSDVVLRYGARLANVPMPSLRQLCFADVNALTAIIMGFSGQSE